MNLNQLEYFITVAENLNFTKAAAKCFISQTAMTQQIKALEKKIGVPLFLRDKHHVELTAAGKVYLNEARIVLDRANEAIRMARMASEGAEGEITIGFISGYGQNDFSDILRSFYRAYPRIRINLVKNNMSVLMDQLDRGECDMVFAISSRKSDYDHLEQYYLRSYPVMAVLYADHRLAARPNLTYEDLKEEDFIMMQPANRPKDQMEESMLIYERGGYLPNVVAVEGDQETLLLMISVGMGISILPEYITRICRNSQNLKILPMVKRDGTTESVDLHVSWSKKNANPAMLPLLEMLKQ